MIAMYQNKKLERSLIQKEYRIDLEMFYPHTCTSWSKGMPSFSLDPSFDSKKYSTFTLGVDKKCVLK